MTQDMGKTIDEIIEPLYKETFLNLKGERFFGDIVLAIQNGKLGPVYEHPTHREKKGGDSSEK